MSSDAIRVFIDQLVVPSGTVDSSALVAALERELTALLDTDAITTSRSVGSAGFAIGGSATVPQQLAAQLAALLRET